MKELLYFSLTWASRSPNMCIRVHEHLYSRSLVNFAKPCLVVCCFLHQNNGSAEERCKYMLHLDPFHLFGRCCVRCDRTVITTKSRTEMQTDLLANLQQKYQNEIYLYFLLNKMERARLRTLFAIGVSCENANGMPMHFGTFHGSVRMCVFFFSQLIHRPIPQPQRHAMHLYVFACMTYGSVMEYQTMGKNPYCSISRMITILLSLSLLPSLSFSLPFCATSIT